MKKVTSKAHELRNELLKSSEPVEKCASLQEKNVNTLLLRRTHDQYRLFSCQHPDLFPTRPFTPLLAGGIKPNKIPYC